MEVMLIGGPYNGMMIDVKEQRGFPTQREIWFPVPWSSEPLSVDDFLQPAKIPALDQFLYVLEPTYLKDKPQHFEYHYQGR